MNEYQVIEQIPSVEDYINIRVAAGLFRKSEKAAEIGLKNSLHAVCIVFEGKIVGIGRVVGDGGCFFDITDIAVLPEHHKKGLGRLIMENLVAYIHRTADKSAFVSLFAEPGFEEFYEKFGFQYAYKAHITGMNHKDFAN